MRRSARARSLVWLLVLAAAGSRAGAESQALVVDPDASQVVVHLGRAGLLKFLGHEHHIAAPIAQGRVLVVEDDPARSSLELRFESAQLAVIPGSEPAEDIPKVEERMRGPEVLEVARYPEIRFASTSVRTQAADSTEAANGSRFRLVVAGRLTLREREFPIEIPLEVTREPGGLEARGELTLKLKDVGIQPFSVAGVVKVANDFRLEFRIRASALPHP